MNTLMELIRRDMEASIDKSDCQYVFIGNPNSMSKQALDKGVCLITPESTEFEPVTTGVLIQDVKRLKIIFAKSIQDEFNKNAQKENGAEWLSRIMEGRNEDGTLMTNTGIFIVLSNLKTWGKLQATVATNYNTDDIENTAGAVAQGNITIEQKDIYNLLLN